MILKYNRIENKMGRNDNHNNQIVWMPYTPERNEQEINGRGCCRLRRASGDNANATFAKQHINAKQPQAQQPPMTQSH